MSVSLLPVLQESHLFTHSFNYCLAITSAQHKGKRKSWQALKGSQAQLVEKIDYYEATVENSRCLCECQPFSQAESTFKVQRKARNISDDVCQIDKHGWESRKSIPQQLHELCSGASMSQSQSVHKGNLGTQELMVDWHPHSIWPQFIISS